MTETLITPDNTWLLWAVLIASAMAGIWAEHKTKLGARVSGCLVTMAIAFLLSNFQILPPQSGVYDVVWGYLVPLAIPLLLFKSDLKRIFTETGPPLKAYGLGALGTAVGTMLAIFLVPVGELTWKVAGIFSATYIGGSLNFVAAAEALSMKGETGFLMATVAADNLIMALYFFILFLIPGLAFFQRHYPMRHQEATLEDGRDLVRQHWREVPLSLYDMGLTFTVAFLIAAGGKLTASAIGAPSTGILILTALTVLLATGRPGFMGSLKGGEEMGMILMQIFFATVGATAHIGTILHAGPRLFLFAALVITIHSLTVLIGSKLLGLNLDDALVASNANIGGPTTAAAMAIAKGWNHLIIPAILCGTLGYALGTYAGVALAHLAKLILG